MMTHHHNPKRPEFFSLHFQIIFFFTKSIGYDAVCVGVISGCSLVFRVPVVQGGDCFDSEDGDLSNFIPI
jgi:hypothetical protein